MSPVVHNFPQSNGVAKCTVGLIKSLLKKEEASSSYLALLLRLDITFDEEVSQSPVDTESEVA